MQKVKISRQIYTTRNSGPYGPFFLAPAEGWEPVGLPANTLLGKKNCPHKFMLEKQILVGKSFKKMLVEKKCWLNKNVGQQIFW